MMNRKTMDLDELKLDLPTAATAATFTFTVTVLTTDGQEFALLGRLTLHA